MFRTLLIVISLCLVSGCAKQAESHKRSLRLTLTNEPVSLDPRKARDLSCCVLIRMLFEGLTRTSRDGFVELALAQEMEMNEDGRQYVFHLRHAKWSNGDPVTSFDFADTWRTVLDRQFPSDAASQLFLIKNARKIKYGELPLSELGVATPDAQTLVVELEEPTPYFAELVSLPVFFPVPSKYNQPNANREMNFEDLVSNGPFHLKTWHHNDSLEFVKNTAYWQASDVKMEKIEAYIVSPETGIWMFQEGKLDWTGSPLSTITPSAIPSLSSQSILKTKPFSGTCFLRVNTSEQFHEKKNPLSNLMFRQALAAAIDRKSISEHLLQGGQLPALGLVPPDMGLSANGYFSDADLTAARSYLQAALYEMGCGMEQLDPILLSFSGERAALIAQVIQKQWAEALGIHIELEEVETKIYYQRVSQRQFQLAIGSWMADFNDPINFLEVFKYRDGGTNNTGWENSRFIDLLNRSSQYKDVEERKRCLSAAEKILMDQMPIIPIFHYVMNFLMQEGLQDVAFSPIGAVDFRWAYWEDSDRGPQEKL